MASTWRILLYLAAMFDWEIHQIDIIAVFLNGNLEERVYMKIPDGLREILADFFKKYPKENTISFKANYHK